MGSHIIADTVIHTSKQRRTYKITSSGSLSSRHTSAMSVIKDFSESMKEKIIYKKFTLNKHNLLKILKQKIQSIMESRLVSISYQILFLIRTNKNSMKDSQISIH